jgi:outer membrane protein assembly factor BamB
MKHSVVLAAALLAAPVSTQAQEKETGWPGFRGPHARGIAEGYATPTRWNVETGENIKWRTPVPGLAHSSPAIWGDRLFVTSAIRENGEAPLKVGLYGDIAPASDDVEQSWIVYAVDKETGEVLWERTAHRGEPKQSRHPKSTHANSTPATDGERVVAFFASEGLYSYDMEGKLLWKKDLGTLEASFFEAPEAQWGFASSPVIDDGVVYLQCDVLNGGFLTALRASDGQELWRTKRSDVPTWSSPTVHQVGEQKLVIVNGWKHIGAYDATTGQEVWRLEGRGDIPVPTPVVSEGLAFITNAHGPGSPIYAIRVDARGDISLEPGTSSNESVVWSIGRGGAYMQTPLVHDGLLYNCRDNGVLSCYRSKTGERMYQERLGGGTAGFSASPVAANGKIYFTSEEGDVYVVKAGETFELLAKNSFDEEVMATPAISEGTIYFRTRSRIVAVAEDP